MLVYFCIFNLLYCIATAVDYNTYYARPATTEEISDFQARNISDICVSSFEPCDKNEWRRVDGSCNNLKNPSLGMYHTPMWRMLPPHYSNGSDPSKSQLGKSLPLARYARLQLLKVGDAISEVFTTALAFFAEFAFGDVGSVHDINLYIFTVTHCCTPEGLTDERCAPNFIPKNDNVHRFTNITCLNMTRPLSFQSTGCAPADVVPERINFVTTFFDLSNIYNHVAGSILQNRAFEGGRLKVEVVNGGSYPSDANETTTCFIKDAVETGCTRTVPNGLLGTNLFTTWFWRLHNFNANALAKMNPCWKDQKTYNAAKEITIAFYNQILFYEFYLLLLGKENMIRDGIIGADKGFRDPYDETVKPRLAIEFAYALRWFHTIQDGTQEMYDKDDKFITTRRVVDYSLRVQDLAYDNTLLNMTHGNYMQPCGAFDDTAHPDITESGLGPLAEAFDIPTADYSRAYQFFLAPYSEYRDFCTNYEKKHERFEDFSDVMEPHKIDEVSRIFEHPKDIPVMAGMWAETLGEKHVIPPTAACLISKQLKISVASDRHHYERKDRPHAFTEQQLQEIRKASFARLLCDVGDEVTEIQPKAFLRIGPGNLKVSCDEIPSINFEHWKDESCSKDSEES